MSTLVLRLDTSDTDVFVTAADRISTGLALQQLFKSMTMGGRAKPASLRADVTPVAASKTLTLDHSTFTGTVGGVINGVTITVSAGADDVLTVATAIATAINASVSALVAGFVTATAAASGLDAVVTITATDAGKAGNAITLAASGTGVTAGGARLTGGTNGTTSSFTY